MHTRHDLEKDISTGYAPTSGFAGPVCPSTDSSDPIKGIKDGLDGKQRHQAVVLGYGGTGGAFVSERVVT